MDRSTERARKRGRPPKFGRPARVVALTLPDDVIDRLHRVHRDLGWAIVKLLETKPRAREEGVRPDVELVTVGNRQSLIVVNRDVIKGLPGINIIPLAGNQAFLALDVDRGMSDLELAVSDRLAEPALGRRERRALATLRAQLTTWRRNQKMRVRARAIIVLEGRSRIVSPSSTRSRA